MHWLPSAGRRGAMARYLVVANQTIGGSELITEIRRRIWIEPSSFYVLVPMMPVVVTLSERMVGDGSFLPSVQAADVLRDQAQMTAQSQLSRLMTAIRAKGAEADGSIGGSHPIKAIEEVVVGGGFDEIIISTLPVGVARWLRMDIPNRVKRRLKIPVTTVTSKQ